MPYPDNYRPSMAPDNEPRRVDPRLWSPAWCGRAGDLYCADCGEYEDDCTCRDSTLELTAEAGAA